MDTSRYETDYKLLEEKKNTTKPCTQENENRIIIIYRVQKAGFEEEKIAAVPQSKNAESKQWKRAFLEVRHDKQRNSSEKIQEHGENRPENSYCFNILK